MSTDVFNGIGVEVDIKTPENFIRIREVLSRIGIASPDEKKLFQSCHILHKRNELGESKYAIVHFKEMFKLDGKATNISETDLDRRNLIVNILARWDMVVPVGQVPVNQNVSVKIIKRVDKEEWELVSKYTIGKRQ